jgi:hypothetical protein
MEFKINTAYLLGISKTLNANGLCVPFNITFCSSGTLIRWRRTFLQKIIVDSSRYSLLLWNPKVHTVFTKPLQWTPAWTSRIQPKPPQPLPMWFILILFQYLRLGLSSSLFLWSYPINIKYPFFTSHVHATCLHSTLLYKEKMYNPGPKYNVEKA